MTGIIRSELLRLRRRSILIGWFGLVIMFAALINVVMFQVVEQSGTAPANGPGPSPARRPSSARTGSSRGSEPPRPSSAS